MDEKYTGYLFCYFTGREEKFTDEQIYFAVSRDGFHWKDLNHGLPVLQSGIGEGGVRDPFILRMENEKRYVILATDLQIAKGIDWETAAHRGSRKIICWESEDLVHWGQPYFFDTEIKDAGCAWAPEVIYNREKDEYIVFWASATEGIFGNMKSERKKQKIYFSTTKDFHTFTEPEIYIEKEKDVIDTTMIWNDGKYYRFSKDEVSQKIIMEKGTDPYSGLYTPVRSELLEKLDGVEGPAVFKLINEEKWCLLVDNYKEKKGYIPLVTNNLDSGVFTEVPESAYDFGKNTKRHGSVMYLTEREWKTLEAHFAIGE